MKTVDSRSTVPAPKELSSLKNFVIGGVSTMIASTVNLPVDFVKVHLQVAREGQKKGQLSALQLAQKLYKAEGWKAFYSGLDSVIMKQATYGAVRLGMYRTLSERDKRRNGTQTLSFWRKALYSSIGGAVGAIAGNPADLTLVRVQADRRLPIGQRRNYAHFFNAFARIYREEGVLTYWRGVLPNMMRCVATNVGMLAPYDQSKELLEKMLGPSPLNNVCSSFIAVLCACVLSLPFDNMKTKFQNMHKLPGGQFPYTGMVDCAWKTARTEGISGFYVAYGIYVLKFTPHVIVTLLVQDLLHYLLG